MTAANQAEPVQAKLNSSDATNHLGIQLAMPTLASPSRYRIVILALVWLSYVMVYLARLSVGPLAPLLKESLGLSNAGVGALTGATALTYAPTLIVAGVLVDRVGCRRILLLGTGLAAACALACRSPGVTARS